MNLMPLRYSSLHGELRGSLVVCLSYSLSSPGGYASRFWAAFYAALFASLQGFSCCVGQEAVFRHGMLTPLAG